MILGSKSQTRLAALDVQQMWKSCLLPHSEIVLEEIHSHMTCAGDRGTPRGEISEIFQGVCGGQGYQICNVFAYLTYEQLAKLPNRADRPTTL